MKKVCHQLSLFFYTNRYGGNPCTNQVQNCLKNGNQVATQKTSKSRFSLKDKKSKFSLILEKRLHELSLHLKRKSSREMENERIRILLERQKEQILAEVRSEIQKHKLQAESDSRRIQELNGIIESQRREIDHTIAG